MTSGLEIRLHPLGDAAVLVEVTGADDEAVERRVLDVAAAATALHASDSRFGQPVPGFSSVLVPVDPIEPGVVRGLERLRRLVEDAAGPSGEFDARSAPLVELPTRYGGPDGPDLEEVAALRGLRASDVVDVHASTTYRVRFLGFMPGFAYLWRLPAVIAAPRLSTPRERVPAGSVAIAGDQTAVYPFASPGGWRLIGRTNVRLWDPSRDEPAVLRAGMRVRFVPIV